MDRRGWPWKKKSSNKNIHAEKPVTASESVDSNLSSVARLGDQDICKIKNYVQISMESYTHMSELEGKVKNLEDQVKALEERLSAAYSELNNKDNLVKQHAKVAEEAVSGWEKADAEVDSLRRQLESITLLKLTVDDRASHLDGALKECMRQIRNVKEESEQKLQDVILTKTKQWERIKFGLEAKIDKLDRGLLQAAGENASLLRSLQESSNKLMKIKEEKSQAEAEIDILKKNSQSYEKEITSLRYELHVVSKELDIRNEEKNISIRSAEVSNRQHIEDVKKIAKLEAECQKLRGLVRKKLPGPAALAQMKLEVESLGRVNSEPYLRKTSIRNNIIQDSEFLIKKVMELEEETKILKEALATSNAELRDSRNLYAETVGRLNILEAQRRVFDKERSCQKSNLVIHSGSPSSRMANNPPSISINEDGPEDPGSSVESFAASIPDLSDVRRGNGINISEKNKNETISELMEDFLEMEKMACLSGQANKQSDAEDEQSDDAPKAGDLLPKQWAGSGLSASQDYFDVKISVIKPEADSGYLPILKRIQSIISMIINSETKDSNIWKLLEDLQCAMCELRHYFPRTSGHSLSMESNLNDTSYGQASCIQDIGEILNTDVPLTEVSKVDTGFGITAHQDVAAAVSSIHHYVLTLGREAVRLQGNCSNGHELDVNLQEFSASLNQFMTNKTSLVKFVLNLSHALAKTIELHLNYLRCKGKRVDISSSNGTDVVVPDDLTNEMCYDRDGCISQLSSNSEVPKEGKVNSGSEINFLSSKCSSEEFKQMESEKDDKADKHAEYKELLAELKEQLASSQKSYNLAEIQLKCMTESYKSLETHAEELEAENKFLKEKIEELKNELVEQKQCHNDTLARYKDIEEKTHRDKKCLECASNFVEDSGINNRKKDTELAAAEKKLAECQETLYLLGRKLQALCPEVDKTMSHHTRKLQMNKLVKPGHGRSNSYGSCNSNEFDQAGTCSVSSNIQGASEEFSSHNFGSISCLSDSEECLSLNSSMSSSQPTSMLTKSNSSSFAPSTGKHPHGLEHLFSLKRED